MEKFRRRIQGVPQSLDAAYPRNQKEETKLTGNEYSNKCLTQFSHYKSMGICLVL